MRRTIIFVRHGHAKRGETSVPDFERGLTKEGKNACHEVAKRLQKQKVEAKCWITSPAIRALETAKVFAKEMGFSRKAIKLNAAIYNDNSVDGVLSVLRQIDDNVASIMIFGHDPGFTMTVKRLVRNFNFEIPKVGVVAIQWEGSWQDLKSRCGQLVFMTFPMSELHRRNYKAYWKQLKKTMLKQIAATVARVEPTVHIEVENKLPRLCNEIVKAGRKGSKKYILRNIREIRAILATSDITVAPQEKPSEPPKKKITTRKFQRKTATRASAPKTSPASKPAIKR